MSSPSPFVVTRFVNRNGVISWRVDGRLHGLRIRKNFKTRVEAGAEKDALDIKAALCVPLARGSVVPGSPSLAAARLRARGGLRPPRTARTPRPQPTARILNHRQIRLRAHFVDPVSRSPSLPTLDFLVLRRGRPTGVPILPRLSCHGNYDLIKFNKLFKLNNNN